MVKASPAPNKTPPPAKKRKTAATTEPQAGPSAKKAKPQSAAAAAASSKQPLSLEQVAKAVGALCNHLEGRKANDILADGGGEPIHLQIALGKMPKGRPTGLTPKKHKPTILNVPHPARTLGECDVCLFTKDPQREFKDKLAAQNVERVKVIGVSKLKKKYVEHEAKRNLCGDHDVFLSDSRVLPMLPKLIGKQFFKKSKQPAAVDLSRKNLRESLRVAVEGARFLAPSGTLVSINAGLALQPQAHLVANVMSIAKQAVPKLENGWNNVVALYLKSTDTVALPIYQKPV